jgi:hypothetical protein
MHRTAYFSALSVFAFSLMLPACTTSDNDVGTVRHDGGGATGGATGATGGVSGGGGVTSAQVCLYKGRTYAVGETFKEDCNTCSCGAIGDNLVRCTVMYCGGNGGSAPATGGYSGGGGGSSAGGRGGAGGAPDAMVAPDGADCGALAAAARTQFQSYLDSTSSMACQVDSDCSLLHLQSLNCFAACGQLVGAADPSAITAAATSACDPYFGAGCPEIRLACPVSRSYCNRGRCDYATPGATGGASGGSSGSGGVSGAGGAGLDARDGGSDSPPDVPGYCEPCLDDTAARVYACPAQRPATESDLNSVCSAHLGSLMPTVTVSLGDCVPQNLMPGCSPGAADPEVQVLSVDFPGRGGFDCHYSRATGALVGQVAAADSARYCGSTAFVVATAGVTNAWCRAGGATRVSVTCTTDGGSPVDGPGGDGPSAVASEVPPASKCTACGSNELCVAYYDGTCKPMSSTCVKVSASTRDAILVNHERCFGKLISNEICGLRDGLPFWGCGEPPCPNEPLVSDVNCYGP